MASSVFHEEGVLETGIAWCGRLASPDPVRCTVPECASCRKRKFDRLAKAFAAVAVIGDATNLWDEIRSGLPDMSAGAVSFRMDKINNLRRSIRTATGGVK